MRLVLDTKVWISGLLLPTSNSGILIKKWQASKFEVVISSYILQEIGKVLAYPKISKKLQWSDSEIQHYLDLLSFFAETIDVDEVSTHVDADPKDSLVLSTFLVSHADFLVSGDSDLLNLAGNYPIISVAQFKGKLEGY